MQNFKHTTYEVTISFKESSNASFFTCFKALYKKYRCKLKISHFSNSISLDMRYLHEIKDIKKIVSLLKRQPESFNVKYKDVCIRKEKIV